MSFLTNRSFVLKAVKDKDLGINTGTNSDGNGPFITPDPMLGPEIAAAYAEVFKDVVTHTALVVGGVFIACKIVGRICK